MKNSGASQEQDDDRIGDRDEIDPYDEVIFGRRRPDSVAIEWFWSLNALRIKDIITVSKESVGRGLSMMS